MNTSHWPLGFLMAAGILCGCQSPQERPGRTLPPIPANSSSFGAVQRAAAGGTHAVPESLVSLNGFFLEGYKERQAFVRTNISPLIVADFDSLVLYWNGVAETNRCLPDIYHALKVVAHVPFGIFLRIYQSSEQPENPLPEAVRHELSAYPASIAAAEASLPEAGFSAVQMARQKAILTQCKAYLNSVLTTGTASRQELLAFARHVGPWLLQNADEAAAAQLDMTHAVVMEWKRRVPAEEWKSLVVVVRGPQMPRRLNLLTQYFAKVIHEPSHHLGYPLESRRLIYAEFIPGHRDYLDLMATTFVDAEASEAFFGDRWRMSRDLLADGAARHLKRLKFD